MTMKMNTYKKIKNFVNRIGKKFHPKKIILFGSYAYGNPDLDSDVDLLVILPGKGRLVEEYSAIAREIEPRSFPIDLIVRSSREIQNRLALGDSFIEEILTRGKVLYES